MFKCVIRDFLDILFYWVLLCFTGFYWVLLGFTGFYLVLLGITGFYWVLLGFTGFCWVLLVVTGLLYREAPSDVELPLLVQIMTKIDRTP